MNKEFKYIGKDSQRIDIKEKVTGSAKYVEDIEFGPNLVYAAIIESSQAHALIKNIDVSEALKLPGVIKIVTSEDIPFTFGLYMKDRFIFAKDRVRFVGEQLGAVIAQDPVTAKRAIKLIKVDYEPLKPVLTIDDAMKGDTLIHPDLVNYPRVPWFFPKAKTNIAHHRKIRKGDIIKGFDEADLILEDEYKVPRYSHCCIEYHAAVGLYDESSRLTVWTASQSPHTQRNIFAEVLAPLGITHKDVRVITPYVGGGFGAKAGVTMEIFAAALATQVKGRPIKILWSREQEFYNTYQRQGLVNKIKMGVKKDGTITALEHTLYWDSGGYVEYGANVVNATGLSASGPYKIDNLNVDSYCLYTNLPPGGPYRGFGYSEFHFGLESHITRIAKKLKIDPVEIRLKNAIQENDILAYGSKMNPSGLKECIIKTAEAIGWNDDHTLISSDKTKVIGKGFSLFWKAPAMPPNASSAVFLKFNEDGSINILASGMEIGQGYLTVMAQIAAEILTVPVEKIRVETPDTDRNPYEWQTVASHVTWSCGNAVKKAALDARDQIFSTVSRANKMNINKLYLEDENVKSEEDSSFSKPLKDFVIYGIMNEETGTYIGGPILGRGIFMPEFTSAFSDPETGQGGKPNVHYTVGAGAILLEIDKNSGKIRILKAVEAIDAGRAINPDLVNSQIVGGLVQGLATVLYEDMRYDDQGKLLNPNFTDYKIPTALDIPEEIIPIIVEVPQPDGPFGARGIAEHTMIPAACMVANAVENALDIRIKSMPITAEKIILKKLEKK